jgi:hypothetical protein
MKEICSCESGKELAKTTLDLMDYFESNETDPLIAISAMEGLLEAMKNIVSRSAQ